MGRKKTPFYRLVAIDSRKRREGREIERLGWYDPVPKDFSCKVNEERTLYWLSKGAEPSDTVNGIFKLLGLNYKYPKIMEGVFL